MADYAVTTVAVAVHRVGDNPIFGESVTDIRVDDDAGGPYIVISQEGRDMGPDVKPGELAFELDELRIVMGAAMRLLGGIPADVAPASLGGSNAA